MSTYLLKEIQKTLCLLPPSSKKCLVLGALTKNDVEMGTCSNEIQWK